MKNFSGKSLHDAYMTDIVQMLIENGFVAIPCLFKEPWVEVDTVADFESIDYNETSSHRRKYCKIYERRK